MMPPQQQMMAPPPAQQQLSIAQQYTSQTAPLMALVTESNPSYKQRVGELIFKYISGGQLAPPDRIPKITGMLIALPVDEVKQFMSNYDNLKKMVSQANQLIDQQQ